MSNPCTIKGCNESTVGRNLCNKHYKRFMSYGDPLFVKLEHGDQKNPRKGYIKNGIGYLPLTKGSIAIVDPDDLEILSETNWCCCNIGGFLRAQRCRNGKKEYMHRIIMDAKNGKIVDHINHDTLDNRRYNLRICNKSQSQWNKKAQGGTSKHKGVCWSKRVEKWIVSIGYKNKRIHIGYFCNEEEAAIAYNKEAIRLHGEFAFLNSIPKAG